MTADQEKDEGGMDATKVVGPHWADGWHQHACPQCFRVWTCGRSACDPKDKRFCPNGELCHVGPDGRWNTKPLAIRKGRGVGPLFKTRGKPVVSPYQTGDQSVARKKKKTQRGTEP
jgi:hypothetical protein